MAKSPKGKKGKKSTTKITEDKIKEDKIKEGQEKKEKKDQAKEEKSKEEKSKEEKSKEDKPKEDKPKEDKPKEDKPKEDQAKEDQAKEDQEEEDQEKEDEKDTVTEDLNTEEKPAETDATDTKKDDDVKNDEVVPEKTNDKDEVTEDEPMEITDDSNKSNNEETVPSKDVTDSEKEDSIKVNEVTEKSDDKKTDESSITCTELNDSIIICENDKKDESSEILSTDVSEVDRSFEEISEGEIMSSNEIEEAATATQIAAQDEQTVEDGEEWTLESRLQSFMKWCQMKGITLSPKVKVTSEGTCHRYGMIATADIKKGELLFNVPRALTLHPDNSRIVAEIVDYEDWLDSIGQSLDDSSGWATLLIALMLEFNDKDSFWAPYLRLVPKREEFGHPLFWTSEEHKDELQGTTLLYDVQRDVYNIESEYKQFILPFIYRYKDICGRTERYNLSLYKRLVAFVMAYSFTEDFDSQPGMVPLADLLNHSVNNNAYLIFGEDDLKMVALKKIEKGEEIFNTFGKLGNAELLQMYGYADAEPNIFDSLPILVNTFFDAMEKQEKVTDSVFQAKVSLLDKTEIAPADDFFLFDRNGMRKGPDLVQMLKILFMPDTEFEELLQLRAGNRPDSFYQKLLRKLKLARKTDTSSGVAIIDITEEEPEIEAPPKRKIVDLHEIDDNEPPCKQGRGGGSGDMHMMYLQLAHNHPEQTFPLNMLQSQYATYENNPARSNGNSKSCAIVIDDSDEDGDSGDEKKSDSETDNADKVKSKRDKKAKEGIEKWMEMQVQILEADAEADDETDEVKDKDETDEDKTEASSEKDTDDKTSENGMKDKDDTVKDKVDENSDSSDSATGKDTSKEIKENTSEEDTSKKGTSKEEATESAPKEDTSDTGDTTKEDVIKEDKSKEASEESKEEEVSGESKEEEASGESKDEKASEESKEEKASEESKEEKASEESKEDKSEVTDVETDKLNEEKKDTDAKTKSKEKADTTDAGSKQTKGDDKVKSSDSKEENKKVNGDISDVVSIGDDIEDDLGEDDSEMDDDVDDIEIVSEDIRCKIIYANLCKELKPEWKEFLKSVLTQVAASLKADEEMTADEARAKMSDRAFYAYQIRQGQRFIVKTFISSLAT